MDIRRDIVGFTKRENNARWRFNKHLVTYNEVKDLGKNALDLVFKKKMKNEYSWKTLHSLIIVPTPEDFDNGFDPLIPFTKMVLNFAGNEVPSGEKGIYRSSLPYKLIVRSVSKNSIISFVCVDVFPLVKFVRGSNLSRKEKAIKHLEAFVCKVTNKGVVEKEQDFVACCVEMQEGHDVKTHIELFSTQTIDRPISPSKTFSKVVLSNVNDTPNYSLAPIPVNSSTNSPSLSLAALPPTQAITSPVSPVSPMSPTSPKSPISQKSPTSPKSPHYLLPTKASAKKAINQTDAPKGKANTSSPQPTTGLMAVANAPIPRTTAAFSGQYKPALMKSPPKSRSMPKVKTGQNPVHPSPKSQQKARTIPRVNKGQDDLPLSAEGKAHTSPRKDETIVKVVSPKSQALKLATETKQSTRIEYPNLNEQGAGTSSMAQAKPSNVQQLSPHKNVGKQTESKEVQPGFSDKPNMQGQKDDNEQSDKKRKRNRNKNKKKQQNKEVPSDQPVINETQIAPPETTIVHTVPPVEIVAPTDSPLNKDISIDPHVNTNNPIIPPAKTDAPIDPKAVPIDPHVNNDTPIIPSKNIDTQIDDPNVAPESAKNENLADLRIVLPNGIDMYDVPKFLLEQEPGIPFGLAAFEFIRDVHHSLTYESQRYINNARDLRETYHKRVELSESANSLVKRVEEQQRKIAVYKEREGHSLQSDEDILQGLYEECKQVKNQSDILLKRFRVIKGLEPEFNSRCVKMAKLIVSISNSLIEILPESSKQNDDIIVMNILHLCSGPLYAFPLSVQRSSAFWLSFTDVKLAEKLEVPPEEIVTIRDNVVKLEDLANAVYMIYYEIFEGEMDNLESIMASLQEKAERIIELYKCLQANKTIPLTATSVEGDAENELDEILKEAYPSFIDNCSKLEVALVKYKTLLTSMPWTFQSREEQKDLLKAFEGSYKLLVYTRDYRNKILNPSPK